MTEKLVVSIDVIELDNGYLVHSNDGTFDRHYVCDTAAKVIERSKAMITQGFDRV